MLQLYIAHPFETRKIVKPIIDNLNFKFDVLIFNPHYDIDFQKPIVKRMDNGENICLTSEEKRKIRELDLKWIKSSDGLLVYYTQPFKAWGTVKEMSYAYYLGKPVYLVTICEKFANHIFNFVEVFKWFRSWYQFEEYLISQGYLRK